MLTDERLRELWQGAAWYGPWPSALRLMRAVEAEARREALEESAKVCDRIESGHYPDEFTPVAGVAWECAAAIRALKKKP